jgi:GNAT superfamily N-acetyltransferase
MGSLVPFDRDVHLDAFIEMYVDYLTSISDTLSELYGIDTDEVLGQTIPEWVNDNLEPYISMKPPVGILYIIEVDEDVAGMGGLKRLSKGVGEVKRMYNRPKYRGKGYGRLMLNRLLEDGQRFGCTLFRLDTPNWAYPAHHLYRSSGFTDRERYPESEIPPPFQPYWIYMEKREA